MREFMEVDKDRYARNLMLEGFSLEEQRRLHESHVGIVGAGALGSVVAMYLSGAGVGCLRIADYDTVSIGNLQRQVFFREDEEGKSKSEMLAERVRALNGGCNVECLGEAVTAQNIGKFVAGCDVVAVCTDTHASKAMIVEEVKRLRAESVGRGGAADSQGKAMDDIVYRADLPVVVGGVREYQGQVAVFTGDSVFGYGDLFPVAEGVRVGPPGVFSPVPGIVGSIQASEVLKLLTGIGEPLANTLLHFDVRDMQVRRFSF